MAAAIRLDRRALLRATLAMAALVAASGHTQYRQWALYRRQHLLIGTCRADAPTYALGKRIAATLLEWLPESSARVSRAPDQQRLASLITTGQMEVIVLSLADAAALDAGVAPFETYGPSPLAALFTFGDYLLVSRFDFPDRHAWLVTKTLSERTAAFEAAAPARAGALPVSVHPAALAYAAGEPEPPAPPVEAEPELPLDHPH